MEKEYKGLPRIFSGSVMEDSYTLVWVNYDDNLNENLDVIETCMKEKSAMTLYDKTDDWYQDARWHSVSQILEDIKSSCIDEGFDEDVVVEFMDDNRDDIVNIIYERDDSDALGDLLKNTDDIPVRIEMLSNYD